MCPTKPLQKLAEKCTIQVAYAIGVSQPVSIFVDTHGTGQIESKKIDNAVREVMDLSPTGIRTQLKLNNLQNQVIKDDISREDVTLALTELNEYAPAVFLKISLDNKGSKILSLKSNHIYPRIEH